MSGDGAGVPLVLHVIPTAVARGAQREARALADRLDEPGVRHHRLLSLFAGPREVPVDEALDHPSRSAAVAQGYDPRLVLHLRRLLVERRPAAVVAHGGDPLKYLVPAAAGRRLPLAYYATGTFGAAGRAPQVLLWRALVRRASVVACEGEEVLAECRDLLGVASDRLVLAPNGRDAAQFRPRDPDPDHDDADTGAGADAPCLLFVGALNPGKGPERFVEAVAELRRQGHDLRAVACGDGPMRSALQGPAAAAGVELRGTVDDVAGTLRRADVLVFPSRPTGEGMPGVLIEAGLSGLPVVACRVPGVASIVEDGVTGLVVPVDDEPAMVEALRRLLDDAALRRRLGEAARRRCVERFSLDAVVAVWRSFLVPLVERSLRTRGASDGPGTRPGPAA